MYTGTERRQHKRYILRGEATFIVAGQELAGELVNFGYGGMLVRTPLSIAKGTEIKLRVLASCSPYPFEVSCQMMGSSGELKAFQFLERPRGVTELLQLVEQEHYPWTVTVEAFPIDGAEKNARPEKQAHSDAANGLDGPEDQMNHVYQLG